VDVGKYIPILLMRLSIIGIGKFLKYDKIPTAFLTVYPPLPPYT